MTSPHSQAPALKRALSLKKLFEVRKGFAASDLYSYKIVPARHRNKEDKEKKDRGAQQLPKS